MPQLFQIAHDSLNESFPGVVTTIRGEPTTRDEAERLAEFLGGMWYARPVDESPGGERKPETD